MINTYTASIPKKGLPHGFVYADDVIDNCIIDAKYAGTDNFMGMPADGYSAPLVVLSAALADNLCKAANDFCTQGYYVKLFDSYRPQRAADHFYRWASNGDIRRKQIHYPNIDKSRMFELGYIARRSGHSRACSIDLTLVDVSSHQELDMGSIFDFMDDRSHHGASGLTKEQEYNRAILRDGMLRHGFELYEDEWWHYSIVPEPYPDTYFDFVIE